MIQRLKILLADDDPDDHEFFISGISALRLPCEITWVKRDEELFHFLENEPAPDLLILDINMPGRDGKQCLKEIKSHERYRHIPVIVMTVSHNLKDVEEVFRDGAHFYAIKPYSHLNYVETLRRIFAIDWKTRQPFTSRENFVINKAFV